MSGERRAQRRERMMMMSKREALAWLCDFLGITPDRIDNFERHVGTKSVADIAHVWSLSNDRPFPFSVSEAYQARYRETARRILALLSEAEPAEGAEPVAWAVWDVTEDPNGWCQRVNIYGSLLDTFATHGQAKSYLADREWHHSESPKIVPLYTSPQPARGVTKEIKQALTDLDSGHYKSVIRAKRALNRALATLTEGNDDQ